MNQTVLLPR